MTSDKNIQLTIVMPCLNEAQTLETCIIKAQHFLQANGISGEVIVADNGSTDGSQEIARRLGARVVPIEIKGYGAALLGGISSAKSKYVIIGDADDSYDFENLNLFYEKLLQGYDLVMGNRFKGEIKPGAMPLLHRYLGNPVLSMIGRLFFRSSIGDFNCGLRGFRQDAILELDLHTTGMEFASEMVVKATIQALSIIEVPTILYPDGRSRPPHLHTWSDGWRHLRFLLLFSPRWLFLYPGIILILIGVTVFSWLIPGPKKIGSVTFDVNTIVFAALAIMIGFQSVFFALFTMVFGTSEGLLSESRGLTKALKFINLERGLLIGAICVLVGLIGSILALHYWQSFSFGPLDPSKSLRIVVPGVTLFAIGTQIILSSFFLSILGMKRRQVI
jgi:glycosyltransferase involved in cell wall biosynthesis